MLTSRPRNLITGGYVRVRVNYNAQNKTTFSGLHLRKEEYNRWVSVIP